jgi:hypothetical protein
MNTDRNDRRARIILFLLLFFSFSYYFHPIIYDNAATRLDLVCAIHDQRTTRIDGYADNTEDKAFVAGHYYCDKAPGVSLLAAGVLELARPVMPPDACSLQRFSSLQYALALLLLGLPTAFAGTLLFRAMRTLGVGLAGAFLLCVSWGLGTNVLTYATHVYDHQFTALLTFFSLYIAWRLRRAEREPRAWHLAACGFLLGYAAISEYPSAVVGAIIGLYLLAGLKSKPRILWVVLGALPPLAALAVYNHVSFGSALKLGYFYEVHPYFRAEMARGIGGVTYPRPGRFLSMLFLPERGLFWGSPFLLAAIPGFAWFVRRERALGWTCLAAVVARMMVNASYYDYFGGATPGPRFLVPALPFIMLAVAAFWANSGRMWKAVVAGLCLEAVGAQTIINLVQPHVMQTFNAPLGFEWPLLRQGYQMSNAGTLAGLPSVLSALPLAAVTALCLTDVFLKHSTRKNRLRDIAATLCVGALAAGIYFAVGTHIPPKEKDQAHFYIGVALNQNGRYDAAVREFRRSLLISPKYVRAHFHMGTAYVNMKRYDEAAKAFRIAAELAPDNFQCRMSLAAAEMMGGDLRAARRDLDIALSLNPSSRLAQHMDSLLKSNGL